MTGVSDEVLMAYADGELSGEEARFVAAAIAGDASLRARFDSFVETRVTVAKAFGSIAEAPVPDALIDFVRSQQAPASRGIGPSNPRHADRTATRSAGQHGAFGSVVRGSRYRMSGVHRLAASIALVATGVALAFVVRPPNPGEKAGSSDAAGGANAPPVTIARLLETALETAESSTVMSAPVGPSGTAGVRVIMTFKGRDGGYCRKYTLAVAEAERFSGLACRSRDFGWLVEYQGRDNPAPSAGAGLRPAGSGKATTLDAVIDNKIEGGLLDPEEERQLIADRWHR